MAESWMQYYARTIVCRALARIRRGRLALTVEYLGEQDKVSVFGEQPSSASLDSDKCITVLVRNPNAWVRLCQAFDLGFSEAYMLQEVDCNDLVGLFSLYLDNAEAIGAGGNMLSQAVARISRLIFRPVNTVSHAKLNASFHYDTSNALFAGFLDPSMTYSCAIWSGAPDEPLESAQRRKLQAVIDRLCLSPSHHLLDIGCGWGSLAIDAVKQSGCRVTGITASWQQRLLAEDRIKSAGLQDKIDIVLCDYRQAPKPEGGYDRIVSLEMLEHVGEKFMARYFESISNLLKPEAGILVIQGITMVHKIRLGKPDLCTFIDRYVFPGGHLPTLNQLFRAMHDGSGGSLEVDAVQSLGPHYIHTLQCWRANLLRNWEAVKRDFVSRRPDASEQDVEAHRRRWLYYFQYCEAGFRTRTIGDVIIVAARAPWPEIPSNVPH